MSNVCVIGAGSFGTSLAITLAEKGNKVNLWARNAKHISDMADSMVNERYLPGIKLHSNITPMTDMKKAIDGAKLVLFSVPAQNFRGVFNSAMEVLNPEAIIVNVAKGIEKGTLLRMSQVAKEVNPNVKYAVLSGPSHAEEVGKKLPTTVAIASSDRKIAEYVQDMFFTDRFRTYVNDDVVGVELGGSLKNIIALGAGISDGMGFGDNAKAALMTRGMTEITRLGLALGALPETFYGLAGMGDLIVTCTSMHSRNRRCGIMIGEGVSPDEATEKIGMVVEGMFTTEAAYDLAKTVDVEMPITEHIYKVIKGEIDPVDAVTYLMGRERKHEKI